MQEFPHQYEVSQRWGGEALGVLEVPGRSTIAGGPPPQFDGPPDVWSPEHLLLASVDLCLMTTFMSLARKKTVPVNSYRSRTTGTLDRTKEGLVFTKILQTVEIVVPKGGQESVEKLMASAKKYCLVANALKPEVTLQANVSEAAS